MTPSDHARIQLAVPVSVALTVAVPPWQKLVVPLTVAVGRALTVTDLLHVELHPLASVTVKVTVNEPAEEDAVTETDCDVVDPTIEPLPLIDQLYVSPAGALYELPAEDAHTPPAPVIEQVGLALTVTVVLAPADAQPLAVRVTV